MADMATSRPADLPQSKDRVSKTGSERSLKQKAPELGQATTSYAGGDNESQAETNGEDASIGDEKGVGYEGGVEPDTKGPDVTDRFGLQGKKVNKAGNIVDENGKPIGRIVEGEVSKLVGKKSDREGKIWSDSGTVIGNAEVVPIDEREETSEAPFEDFPGAVVDSNANVTHDGQVVGKLVEGDSKRLAGKKVEKDGEVVDKFGNVLGKAERWTEPDEPEREAVDMSVLAGKRVNKLGNIVDPSGQIIGRLIDGDPKKLAGRMCDKNGNIRNEMGDVAGKTELVPEAEREGERIGPFADFDNTTVTKEGTVVDARGSVIGRLIDGDPKKLFGKEVDSDGDVLDKKGNTLGRAERWEEEEKYVAKHPAAGLRVNREGNVADENGDVIAELTEGEASKCTGKEIDDDGDVVDGKGKTVGHVTLLDEIPPPGEPRQSEEQIREKRQLEEDNKLASQLATNIEQSVDKVKPILRMITEAIDTAESQPEDERDEEKLVDTVKPLLEQGGGILQECNGAIRALDPDGRIQNQAKHNTASRHATPEEHRLAEQLKELAGSVTQTIEQAKKKVAGMPHAKKELNPLWGLLAEPLGQIIAAVGLLLSGVLGLVGRLLSGLGLGGLLDSLLGGLGIKGILEGLGLGTVTKSLTGKK